MSVLCILEKISILKIQKCFGLHVGFPKADAMYAQKRPPKKEPSLVKERGKFGPFSDRIKNQITHFFGKRKHVKLCRSTRAVARRDNWGGGGGCIFIYSCSHTVNEYMNIPPPNYRSIATAHNIHF